VSNFFTPEFNNESAIAPWNASLEPTKAIIPQLDANRVLTGGVSHEVNLPTLTPEAYDNIILPDDLLTRKASAVSTDSNSSLPDSSVDLLTGQAMSEVYGDLSKFAAGPDFVAKMNLAFGENWDATGAKALAEGWFQGDFSEIPPVKVVSSAEIAGANGAFAAATDTIYLSQEFLAENAMNPAAVADVLLEEIGHSVDARLNVADSPGDEGAIFAAVVQGKELSQGEIQALKSEDDTATVAIDGHKYLVEKQLNPAGSIGSFYNRNPAIAQALGRDTGAEFQFSPGKWRQNFQGGAIFHSAQGTYSVRGSLGNYYLSLGGQDSQLGLPTSEEFQVPNGWRQNFQGGAIFHSGAGSYMARGSLGNYYLNNLGGQDSQLGLPTSNEFQVPNGWRQNFERGYVNWWNTGNGTFTLNSSPLVSSTPQANSFFKLQYRNPTYNSSGPNGSTNCGPASVAMIRKMFGMEQANISVETSIDHARYLMFGYSNGTSQGVTVLNQDQVWTSFDHVKNGIRNSGGTAEELTGWDNLDRSLAAGKPVINYGTLTNAWRGQFPSRVGSGSGGHWNAILGKTSDGKYIVADPMHEGGTVAMTKTQLSVFNANPLFIAFARR